MKLSIAGVILVSAFAGFAAELYVSSTGAYETDDGVDHEAYTDLQAAIDAAANSGDKIWVEDNFVCESEATSSTRLNVAKSLTISSRSGKWENGVTVVADSSRRCITVTKTGGGASQVNGDLRLIGFRLTGEGQTVNQGGLYVADGWARFDMENCAVYGFTGGENVCDVQNRSGDKAVVAISTIRNCVVSNNFSNSINHFKNAGVVGGRVYDTLFVGNFGCGSASSYETSDTKSVVSNCVFVCNTNANANAGGAMYIGASDGSFRCYDTKFIENTFNRNITYAAAACGYGTFVRCDFIGNGWKQCCSTVQGKGKYGIRLYDCIVSNSVAESSAGVLNVYASNTVIACNTATSNKGGGGATDSWLEDCEICGNVGPTGAGARGCVLTNNCRIHDNVAKNNDAEGGGGARSCILTNCLVYGNVASNNCYGGGLYCCTATLCRVTGNRSMSNGGGAYRGLLIDCLIDSNNACAIDPPISGGGIPGYGGGVHGSDLVGCVVSNNTAWYWGGGYYGSGTTKNCIFVENNLGCDFTWIGAYANGGSAIAGGTHYNALVTGNIGNGKYGSTISSWHAGPIATLVNCTVVDNDGGEASGGVDDWGQGNGYVMTVLVNTIMAQNKGTAANSYRLATNSYVTVAGREGVDVGCIYGNEPKLGTVEGFAYTPLGSSKCRNNALKLDWMTNETDVCSKDIYGHDRIIGSAPDIGAVERKGYGIMLLVR